MIYRFIILIAIATWMVSCQQDEYVAGIENSTKNGDAVPVSISFSSDDLIEQGTGYEPMTRISQDINEIVLRINNQYRVILIKEIGDKLIVDSIMTGIANKKQPTYGFATFKRGESFSNLDMVLTPGKYHLVIFTGINSMAWNSNIKKGLIIKDDTRNPLDIYAFKYRVGTSDYSNHGLKTLNEEILTGKIEFTVNKTDDLHSSPDPALSNLKIQLKRNVTKFRIALHYTPTPDGDNFRPSTPPVIKADMNAINGTKFCDGLNIWGDPWYDPVTPLTYMKYSVEGTSILTAKNGEKYHISDRDSRVYAPYFFLEKGKNIDVELSNVTVSFESNSRTWGFDKFIIPITLKHNTVDGIIFKPGSYTDTNVFPPVTEMELEVDGENKPINTLDEFGYYFEIN